MSRVRHRKLLSATLHGVARVLVFWLITLTLLGRALPAHAQPKAARPVTFEWDETRTKLRASLSYRDLIDGVIRQKLSRGLTTTIVLTATLHQVGKVEPIASTVQTCKITWHVWEEAYRIEVSRPAETISGWTTTLQGVLRRCAEARRLFTATRDQVPQGVPLLLRGKVVINPVSPEILQKIRRWVSRPAATSTAAPGDALFSTFAGLFLRQIGDAERELDFETRPGFPQVAPQATAPQPAKKAPP